MQYETLYEAQFAARYAARYHERCGKVWRRFGSLITFAELIGGSAAFGAWLSKNPEIGAYMGLVLAISAALNHTFKPAERAANEEQARKAFMGLLIEAEPELGDFSKRLTELCVEYDSSLEALRNPAYNDVAREWGRDDFASKLSFSEKLIGLLS
jgi:hypothetical protein